MGYDSLNLEDFLGSRNNNKSLTNYQEVDDFADLFADNITEIYSLDKAGKNMFDYFNKPALDDAVGQGKEIRFSHDPEAYGECALKWEWDYLQNKHEYFVLEKRGDFWYASK